MLHCEIAVELYRRRIYNPSASIRNGVSAAFIQRLQYQRDLHKIDQKIILSAV